MDNKNDIIRRIIPLLRASSMSPKEIMLWLIMMPNMDDNLLTQLEEALQEESNELAQTYLQNFLS